MDGAIREKSRELEETMTRFTDHELDRILRK
jgi:hypothetical protein